MKNTEFLAGLVKKDLNSLRDTKLTLEELKSVVSKSRDDDLLFTKKHLANLLEQFKRDISLKIKNINVLMLLSSKEVFGSEFEWRTISDIPIKCIFTDMTLSRFDQYGDWIVHNILKFLMDDKAPSFKIDCYSQDRIEELLSILQTFFKNFDISVSYNEIGENFLVNR